MKKLKYIVILAGILFCASACVNEEEDLFENSAAQRMNKAVKEYSDLLEGASEGWVMDYYPADGSMGGYTHTVIFKDGVASVASEVSFTGANGESWPAGTVVKSLFQVKAEQECLLTFDTYNTLFHFWSEPKGSSSPTGYGGDYEFTFKKIGNDTILLKGKKYGNRMQLTKLKEPAGTYLENVLVVADKLTASPRMRIEVGGKTYSCMLSGKLFTCEPGEGIEDITVAYVFTEKGIRLYEPTTIDDVTFQEFELQEDMTLRAIDADAIFPLPTPIEIFCASLTQWNFNFSFEEDKADMDNESWRFFKDAQVANQESYESFIGMYIGANPAYPGNDSYPVCIGWSSDWLGITVWTVAYGIEMGLVAGTSDQISIKLLGGGINYDFYPFLDPLVERIGAGSPYKITFDDEKAPKKAKLVSTVDPDIWFEVAL